MLRVCGRASQRDALPEGVFVRCYEERMDLLRAVRPNAAPNLPICLCSHVC